MDNDSKQNTAVKCLIVEDSRVLSERISKTLRRKYSNIEIDTAYSMEEALSKVDNEENHYDFAFLDIWLPETETTFSKCEEILKEIEDKKQRIFSGLIENGRKIEHEEMELLRREKKALEDEYNLLTEEKGGLEIARHIRSRGTSAFPFIFLTALGDMHIIKEAKDEFGDDIDWLVKPTSNRTILECCEKLFLHKIDPNPAPQQAI